MSSDCSVTDKSQSSIPAAAGLEASSPGNCEQCTQCSLYCKNLKLRVHSADTQRKQSATGIKECELTSWSVAVGDEVEEFQQLCEVASDKAAVEITSRFAGTVERLHHQPGDMVQVGDTCRLA